MTQSLPHSLHSVDLILGINAVEAYENKELSEETLRELGAWKTFSFSSPEERQAFMGGVIEARGYEYVEIINAGSIVTLSDPSDLP